MWVAAPNYSPRSPRWTMMSTGGLVSYQQWWRCSPGLLWWSSIRPREENWDLIYIATLTCGQWLWMCRDPCPSLCQVSGLTCRDKMRSSDRRIPLCQMEPAEVVQASDQDVSWLSPFGGIRGTSNMSYHVSELTCASCANVCVCTNTPFSQRSPSECLWMNLSWW